LPTFKRTSRGGTIGFIEERQAGSHLTLRHDERKVTVTIPVHSGADIERGLAVRILKDAGFSVDDFVQRENRSGEARSWLLPKVALWYPTL